MHFYVLTLFPELILRVASESILGRAAKKEIISVSAVNIRDYSEDQRHHHVDDYPYGGGRGMLMQAGPVVSCCRDVLQKIGKKTRVIYMSPQGKTFSQEMAKELSQEENLVFLCGHYEGIDERAIELCVTDEVSIGDYVLTGGELPALVMIDAISRLVPGVIREGSAELESFSGNLLEYPQYTRPEEFMGLRVPEILLSGHHENVEKWRREQQIRRTYERRPELLPQADLSKEEKRFLKDLEKGEKP